MSRKLNPLRRHVLADVKPYQCIEATCPSWATTCSSLKQLRTHYKKIHPESKILAATVYRCVFCREVLFLSVKERFAHVGRHLEGIAFSAINYQSQEWDFYSEVGSDDVDAVNALTTNGTDGLLKTGTVLSNKYPARQRPAPVASSAIIEKSDLYQSRNGPPARKTSSLVSFGRKLFGSSRSR